MALAFKEELESKLPEYLFGFKRVQRINQLIEKNEEWQMLSIEEIRKLVFNMIELEASDMDIGGLRSLGKIWYRVYGDKDPEATLPSYSTDESTAMLLSLLSDDQKELLFKDKNVDFALVISLGEIKTEYRLRGDIYFERNTIAATFRMIRKSLFPMEDLSFPTPIIKKMDLQYEKTGLILITGITGSGKSSTLDSIINMNNHNNKGHIIIIGNPIEYIHKSDKSLVTHREVGEDVTDFASGTIQSLRQDPNIIVVGEMRDPKTVSTVLDVTDSGHKVFSTLHTSSAAESIYRIISMYSPQEQDSIRFRLAETLKLVISQKLVPNRRGSLTLAKEILSVNYSVQAALRNNNITELFQMMTESSKQGMYTMQQNLLHLVQKGEITPEIALNYSNNKKVMKQLLRYS